MLSFFTTLPAYGRKTNTKCEFETIRPSESELIVVKCPAQRTNLARGPQSPLSGFALVSTAGFPLIPAGSGLWWKPV